MAEKETVGQASSLPGMRQAGSLPHTPGFARAVERFFGLKEHGSTLRTEVLGGVTTFATMAYIIVVNPAILEFAGLPTGPSTVATILVVVFGSLFMGLYANRPIAVAPYMGENAFIAFGLTALGTGWQLRLGAVFVSGLIFVLLTLLRVRSWLADSVSSSMKYSFAVGIGLFLAFLGLYQTGIVTSFVEGMPAPKGEFIPRPDVPVKLGNLRDPHVLLALLGFVGTSVLLCWRIKGAILLGIVGTAAAGYLVGIGEAPDAVVALPFTGEYDLSPIAFQLDIAGVFRLSFLPILLTLFLMSFLDTLGTLAGHAGRQKHPSRDHHGQSLRHVKISFFTGYSDRNDPFSSCQNGFFVMQRMHGRGAAAAGLLDYLSFGLMRSLSEKNTVPQRRHPCELFESCLSDCAWWH